MVLLLETELGGLMPQHQCSPLPGTPKQLSARRHYRRLTKASFHHKNLDFSRNKLLQSQKYGFLYIPSVAHNQQAPSILVTTFPTSSAFRQGQRLVPIGSLSAAKLTTRFFAPGCWKNQLRASLVREQELPRVWMLRATPCSELVQKRVHRGNGATMPYTDVSF